MNSDVSLTRRAAERTLDGCHLLAGAGMPAPGSVVVALDVGQALHPTRVCGEIRALQGRRLEPGGGDRGSGTYHVVNSMWLLDDMTPDNGATRVVPGSHGVPSVVSEAVEDRLAPYPDEAYMTAPAGSVGVFNGSAWHSCTRNTSGAPRRLLHCAFIAREHKQQTDQRQYLQPETERRLSPLARYVLDV